MLKSLSQVQNLAWLIYPLFTVFGLLISQRPRMLDTCPSIVFSIFISLGIFKVVLLFNYQCFLFLSKQLVYYISFRFVCQELFVFIFQTNSTYFVAFRDVFLSYHIFFMKSRTFFSKFLFLFEFL